jgi:hypothetical protein
MLTNQHTNEFTRIEEKRQVKTLDLAIGVRVPASQPKNLRPASAEEEVV